MRVGVHWLLELVGNKGEKKVGVLGLVRKQRLENWPSLGYFRQ